MLLLSMFMLNVSVIQVMVSNTSGKGKAIALVMVNSVAIYGMLALFHFGTLDPILAAVLSVIAGNAIFFAAVMFYTFTIDKPSAKQ